MGATLAELRAAMERAARDRVGAGDGRLAVLPGRGLLRPEHLADGLHPNDAGHAVLGAAVARALREAGFAPPTASTGAAGPAGPVDTRRAGKPAEGAPGPL
ncbi:hypothetical protein RGF97_28770 [Streptomyces roseicoloratus]|uniref:SGNH hydrolase-type esterase domain-containing protein n=1 Tax=Streptomyces roseicoloratus TaxID=2508722 RepID=A0ABY9S240_9ACTN|nr:hypothetical protein [Streptomyces roseicoloratus]WMX48008.1 hypothetical protein RGF97_28770 [Streptomyces roseicoloratus]